MCSRCNRRTRHCHRSVVYSGGDNLSIVSAFASLCDGKRLEETTNEEEEKEEEEEGEGVDANDDDKNNISNCDDDEEKTMEDEKGEEVGDRSFEGAIYLYSRKRLHPRSKGGFPRRS